MSFLWKIPNPSPDNAALERMKYYFHKPSELMPVPWFMGEITYHTTLAKTPPDELNAKQLENALNDIAVGLVAFPKIPLIWQDWFRYLLPYAIRYIDKSSDWDSKSVLEATLIAFISVYPHQIVEEYQGFREDVIYSLGTRIFPHISSLDQLNLNDVSILWSPLTGDYPGLTDDFNIPMLFVLKYLEPFEITTWVSSIINIENYVWHFTLIDRLLVFDKFLRLAQDWPKDGVLKPLFAVDGLVDAFCITIMHFGTLDKFIPQTHRLAFEKELRKHLTREVLHSWVDDIIVRGLSNAIPEPDFSVVQWVFSIFEEQFLQS